MRQRLRLVPENEREMVPENEREMENKGQNWGKNDMWLRFSAVLGYLPSPKMEGWDSLCCVEIYHPQRRRAEIHCYVRRSDIVAEKKGEHHGWNSQRRTEFVVDGRSWDRGDRDPKGWWAMVDCVTKTYWASIERERWRRASDFWLREKGRPSVRICRLDEWERS